MTCGTYGNDPKIYLKNGEKITMPKPDPNFKSLPEHGHQASWAEACKAGFGSKAHKELSSSFDYSGPLTETVWPSRVMVTPEGMETAFLPIRDIFLFPPRA
jgi:hypothetical protein